MLDSGPILVLAAHPDDEILGCGGTMARAASAGVEVYIAILGEGITSRFARREDADPELLRQLHARSRAVADLVGARDLFMRGLPDNRFDTVPLLDVIKVVQELLDAVRPRSVFVQHGGDLNVDHQVLFRAAMTATRPGQGHTVRHLLAYEVASSTEWAFAQFAPAFQPNIFVNIEGHLETKVQAMELYESEARPFPHPRSPRALRAIAERWGSVAGFPAAEAFQLIHSAL